MIQLKAPWNERNGRFSPLKAAAFAGLFLPAAWIVYLLLSDALEPKVVTELIHLTGKWGIRFLTLTLLVTPLMRSARYPKLVAVRRMLGVAAFAYLTAHLTLYVVDQHFALAATSTDGMIRRLGGERWKRLHSLVYALAALGLLHFMIQAKADVSEPVMMVGFFAILMLFRALIKRGVPAWTAALATAIVSPPLTALIEATWYALVRHIPFWEVLEANIDPDMAFRPSAYVAAAGAIFFLVALARRTPAPKCSAVAAAAPPAPLASR